MSNRSFFLIQKHNQRIQLNTAGYSSMQWHNRKLITKLNQDPVALERILFDK